MIMRNVFKFLISTLLSLILIGIISSCRSYKEVPVQTIEKIVYHDSLIYIRDSILIEVPHEVVKNTILPLSH